MVTLFKEAGYMVMRMIVILFTPIVVSLRFLKRVKLNPNSRNTIYNSRIQKTKISTYITSKFQSDTFRYSHLVLLSLLQKTSMYSVHPNNVDINSKCVSPKCLVEISGP